MNYAMGALAAFLVLTAAMCRVLGVGEPGLPVLPAVLAIALTASGLLPAGLARR